jgi:hypothetical protein
VIDCDSDSFTGSELELEVARILSDINTTLRLGIRGAGKVFDSNGNHVGRWSFLGDWETL